MKSAMINGIQTRFYGDSVPRMMLALTAGCHMPKASAEALGGVMATGQAAGDHRTKAVMVPEGPLQERRIMLDGAPSTLNYVRAVRGLVPMKRLGASKRAIPAASTAAAPDGLPSSSLADPSAAAAATSSEAAGDFAQYRVDGLVALGSLPECSWLGPLVPGLCS